MNFIVLDHIRKESGITPRCDSAYLALFSQIARPTGQKIPFQPAAAKVGPPRRSEILGISFFVVPGAPVCSRCEPSTIRRRGQVSWWD
jgi:hypothetical protein